MLNATYTSLEEEGITSSPLDMQQRHFFYFALSTEFRPHVERDQIFRSSQMKDLLPSLLFIRLGLKDKAKSNLSVVSSGL